MDRLFREGQHVVRAGEGVAVKHAYVSLVLTMGEAATPEALPQKSRIPLGRKNSGQAGS